MYAWHMRVVLEHLRDLGLDFDRAWSRALMSLPRPETPAAMAQRQDWGELLRAQRGLWERAYYKIPRPMLGDVEPVRELVA